MKVLVVGTGVMGKGIAQVFAQNGYGVKLFNQNHNSLSRAYASLDISLEKLVEKGKISNKEKGEILSKIDPVSNLEELSDIELVLEAVNEDIEMKKKIFKCLDEICNKNTIFATNTSSLSITEIASSTNRPDKVIGMHFFNPAPVMELIEIVNGLSTSKETTEKVAKIANSIKKQSVYVDEAPGFIVNRILIPMVNEAACILYERIASVEDIDKSMKLGANHPIGPLALADLIGIDICLSIMDVLYYEFKDQKYRAHPLLRKMVRANQLGRKTGKGFYTY